MVTKRHHSGFRMALGVLSLLIVLQACGEKKEEKGATPSARAAPTAPTQEAAISGTLKLDPSLKEKAGKKPLLMIMASKSPDPNKPAIVVNRVSEATFPYQYKLTSEDITLVGSTFDGKVYVTARIDPAGRVGGAQPGMIEGTYPGNPVTVGSTNVDIVINKAY
ncbi:MAG: hypothetical protein HY278_11045 [candidate division NC10 bacterium]|nr:hypothetical protein [candidate division NC10 bacterium]